MNIPNWWTALLLAAAAWRCFQLVAFDDLFDKPRRYVTRLPYDWEAGPDSKPNPTPDDYRDGLARWLLCPYCFGFWITLAWWAAWQAWPHGTLVVAAPLLLSAALVGIHRLLSSE